MNVQAGLRRLWLPPRGPGGRKSGCPGHVPGRPLGAGGRCGRESGCWSGAASREEMEDWAQEDGVGGREQCLLKVQSVRILFPFQTCSPPPARIARVGAAQKSVPPALGAPAATQWPYLRVPSGGGENTTVVSALTA